LGAIYDPQKEAEGAWEGIEEKTRKNCMSYESITEWSSSGRLTYMQDKREERKNYEMRMKHQRSKE
jgi:hypothetical protein